MAWNQSTDEEIGRFLAANIGRASAYQPYLVVYDRCSMMTQRYLQSRINTEQAVAANETLWKQAWQQAREFLVSEMVYREWLLSMADRILANMRTATGVTSKNAEASQPSCNCVDEARLQATIKAMNSLSQDHRDVYCLRATGATLRTIFNALGTDEERTEHWYGLAGKQLQTKLSSLS